MRPDQVVHSDPEILGGTPVFVGTRVPVRTLIDHLEAGDTIEQFLHSFPSVSYDQAVAARDGQLAANGPRQPPADRDKTHPGRVAVNRPG